MSKLCAVGGWSARILGFWNFIASGWKIKFLLPLVWHCQNDVLHPMSAEIFALSWSQPTCARVPNWSNVSQSQWTVCQIDWNTTVTIQAGLSVLWVKMTRLLSACKVLIAQYALSWQGMSILPCIAMAHTPQVQYIILYIQSWFNRYLRYWQGMSTLPCTAMAHPPSILYALQDTPYALLLAVTYSHYGYS